MMKLFLCALFFVVLVSIVQADWVDYTPNNLLTDRQFCRKMARLHAKNNDYEYVKFGGWKSLSHGYFEISYIAKDTKGEKPIQVQAHRESELDSSKII